MKYQFLGKSTLTRNRILLPPTVLLPYRGGQTRTEALLCHCH